MYRLKFAGICEWGSAMLVSVILFMSFIPAGDYSRAALMAPSAEPGSYVFYRLKFRVQDPVPRPDLEFEMLRMVNEERVARGLEPLVADQEMMEVARCHSRDMFARGYFSHYSPEKISPFDRMKAASITYMKAGENLSMAPNLSMSHSGLMHSTGHRENILKPAFGRVGIGIMDGGQYGIMVTQDFRN